MHVFLDTNIFYNRFKLDSGAFLWLQTYLILTRSKAYISEVSFKEVIYLYKRQLRELKINELEIQFDNLNYKEKYNYLPLKDQIESLWTDYEIYLSKQLKWRCEIIEPDNDFMKECIERAVNKTPPCDKKEEFRDTVIWLTYVTLNNKSRNHIAFISNNTKDFWKEINPILLNDLILKKQKHFLYFHDLEGFLGEYYNTLSGFVDYEYIKENLLTENFCLELLEQEEDNIELDVLSSEFSYSRTNYVQFIDLYELYIKEKFQIEGKELYVISVTIEYETEIEVHSWWHYLSTIMPLEYLQVDLFFDKSDKIITFHGVSDHYFSNVDWDKIFEEMQSDVKYGYYRDLDH